MPDIQQYSVTIKFKTEGSEKASNDAKKVKDSVGQLKGGAKGIEGLTAAFTKMGGAAKIAIGAVAGFVSAGKLMQIGKSMFSLSKQTADYIETVNLFRASMGGAADAATEFIDRAERDLGLDPKAMMDSISSFQNLSEGIGISSDKAYIMSKNLTQLSADLSSFANIPFEQAQQKILSGFTGLDKGLRQYGVSLSIASLQETAYALGIDKKVQSMTKAQKTELYYYQIMTALNKTQGDLGRTLLSPANALRVMQTEFTRLSRAVGSIFIPGMMRIIPVVRAVTQVLTSAAQAIARFFGFEMSDFNADLSSVGNLLEGVGGDIDGVGDSAEDTAKKLNKMLMPFDELNNITSSSGNGGAGTGGVGNGGSLGIDLPEYDMFASLGDNALGGIQTILSTLFEPMQKSWDIHGAKVIESVKESFLGISKLAEAIGKSFVTVWTNGTGEQILNTFLEILTDIFNTIGNIGETWAKVWSKDNTGTTIVQNIANAFKDSFGVIKGAFDIIQEFTKSEEFERFSEGIIRTFKEVSGWVSKMGETFKMAWDNGLKNYFEKTMEFGLKVWELVQILAERLTPTINYAIESIGSVLSVIYSRIADSIEMLNGAFDIIIGLLTGDFSRALEGAQKVLKGFARFILDTFVVGIVRAVEFIVDGVISGINTVIRGINKMGNKLGVHLDEIEEVTWADDIKKKCDEMVDNMFKGADEVNEAAEYGAEQLNETSAKAGIDAINSFNNGIESGSKKTDGIIGAITSKMKIGLDKSSETNQWGASTIQNFVQGISNNQSAVINKINDIKSKMQITLGKNDSYKWGYDMMEGMKKGIEAAKEKVQKAVEKVANSISRLIHFSRPDEGPLRDYETWMPDMIEGLSKTLIQSMPKLISAMAQVSGEIANTLNEIDISKAYDSIFTGQVGVVGDIRNRTSASSREQGTNVLADATYNAISRALESNANNSQPQVIQVNIGNKEVYRGYGQFKDEQSNMLGVNIG